MQTRIILEMCANHNGLMSNATEMIDEAEKLGVWAVKFQKRNNDDMPDDMKSRRVDGKNYFGKTYLEHKEVLEFSKDELTYLKEYAEDRDLVFMCSAFDKKSIDDLIDIGCEWIKLSSQFFSNTKMRDCLMEKDCKRIISCGMHDILEIEHNPWLIDADMLLYCESIYPALPGECNLNTITTIKRKAVFDRVISEKRPPVIGYSSHEFEGVGIKYAIFAGATIVERHYTLNKGMRGHDHNISSDFEEMLRIIREIKEAEAVRGYKEELTAREEEIRNKYKWCWEHE